MLKLRLFLLGFLTLFLELLLIRYLAGTIWNLGYFPNLVLLAVFMGMGIGFTLHPLFSEQTSDRLLRLSAYILFLLIVFVIYLRPAVPGFDNLQGDLGGDLYFNAGIVKDRLFDKMIFLLWFVMTVALFVLISQYTAKVFRKLPPLTAYTMDIAGSLTGIVAFFLISWLQIPAYIWFIVAIPPFIFARQKPLSGWAAFIPVWLLLPMIVQYQDLCLLRIRDFKDPVEVHWSPYQKVEYINTAISPHMIFVNGVTHQSMETTEGMRHRFYQSVYDRRLQEHPDAPYKHVLIIGAGSGNDVAIALDNGVETVDAVEIDPAIAALGKHYHPNHPYQDRRVTLTIDDGRAFMSRTHKQFDLIIFALTDSVVKVSPVSQLRLENYLFTVDAVKRSNQLLQANGDLIFYNWYRQPWLLEKLMKMLAIGMQRIPEIIWQDGHFFILKASKTSRFYDAAKITAQTKNMATDDWPFLYLKERRIPMLYLGAVGVVLAFILFWFVLLRSQTKQRATRSETKIKAAFFVMGAAFLLLETKSVIQFSLLFGTTWINNSLVFFAILSLVLLANRLTSHIQKKS
jgi:spermidine synthase